MISVTRRLALPIGMGVLIAATVVGPALAQSATQSAEERAIRAEGRDYRFTIADLRAWYAAQTAFARYQREHPDEEKEDEDIESLAGYVRKLDARPEVRRILESNSLTSRKFAALTAAWGLAAGAQLRVESGAAAEATAAEMGVPLENLAVLRDNAAELAKMQEKLDAEGEEPQ